MQSNRPALPHQLTLPADMGSEERRERCRQAAIEYQCWLEELTLDAMADRSVSIHQRLKEEPDSKLTGPDIAAMEKACRKAKELVKRYEGVRAKPFTHREEIHNHRCTRINTDEEREEIPSRKHESMKTRKRARASRSFLSRSRWIFSCFRNFVLS